MTIDPASVQISFDFSSRDSAELLQNLKTLFTTPMGTVALDRDFGIDFSVLDKPIPIAKNLYGVEIVQKVTQYEPRVKVQSVTYQTDELNGIVIPKVVISHS